MQILFENKLFALIQITGSKCIQAATFDVMLNILPLTDIVATLVRPRAVNIELIHHVAYNFDSRLNVVQRNGRAIEWAYGRGLASLVYACLTKGMAKWKKVRL